MEFPKGVHVKLQLSPSEALKLKTDSFGVENGEVVLITANPRSCGKPCCSSCSDTDKRFSLCATAEAFSERGESGIIKCCWIEPVTKHDVFCGAWWKSLGQVYQYFDGLESHDSS